MSQRRNRERGRGARRLRRRWFAALGCFITAALITSCGTAVIPVLTGQREWSHESRAEQERWVAHEIDRAIALTLPSGNWRMTVNDELGWAEDREAVLAGARRALCRFEAGEKNPARLQVDLSVIAVEGSPVQLVERLRAAWESDGWTISDVAPPTEEWVYFRADRDDGATLSAEGFDRRDGNTLPVVFLRVHHSCSDHPTMAW